MWIIFHCSAVRVTTCYSLEGDLCENLQTGLSGHEARHCAWWRKRAWYTRYWGQGGKVNSLLIIRLGDDQVQQLFVMFTSVVGGVLHNSSCRACQPGACLCRGSRSTPSSRSLQSGDPSSSGTLPLKRYESQT